MRKPTSVAPAVIRNASAYPYPSATTPAAMPPIKPPPDSKPNCRPITFPASPSALRLMYDCAADQ